MKYTVRNTKEKGGSTGPVFAHNHSKQINERGNRMKKRMMVFLLAGILAVTLFAAAGALADGWDLGLGGLTSLFSLDDESAAYKPGETAVLGDYEVTMTNLMESKGNDYSKPKSGNVFIIAEFAIKNKSGEELAVSSLLCFSAKADDTSYSLSIEAETAALFSGMTQFDMEIAPGKTGTGIVGYEVPSGWKKISITVKPDFYGGEKATFVLEK